MHIKGTLKVSLTLFEVKYGDGDDAEDQEKDDDDDDSNNDNINNTTIY